MDCYEMRGASPFLIKQVLHRFDCLNMAEGETVELQQAVEGEKPTNRTQTIESAFPWRNNTGSSNAAKQTPTIGVSYRQSGCIPCNTSNARTWTSCSPYVSWSSLVHHERYSSHFRKSWISGCRNRRDNLKGPCQTPFSTYIHQTGLRTWDRNTISIGTWRPRKNSAEDSELAPW